MKNQFLRGVRAVGVALTLVLLGVGGVMASMVTVNLGNLALPTSGSGNLTLARANGVVDGATITYDSTHHNAPNATVRTDSLRITPTAATDSIKIVGTLPNTIPVSKIIINGQSATNLKAIIWEGVVTGKTDALSDTVNSFLDVRFNIGLDSLIITGGSITTKARHVVDFANISTLVGIPIVIGEEDPSVAGGKSVTLKSTSSFVGGAAIFLSGPLRVNAPGTGSYTISSDNGYGILDTSTVTADSVLIGNALPQSGVIKIEGKLAAIQAACAIHINNVSNNSKIILASSGLNVINSISAETDSVIYIEGGATVDHTSGTIAGTLEQPITFKAVGIIALYNVKLTNGSNKAVAGSIASGNGVGIYGGSYVSASGTTGNAITSTTNSVVIRGAKITSNAASNTTGWDYVVNSKTYVHLLAGANSADTAEVSYIGSTKDVGAIFAKTKVVAKSSANAPIVIRVTGGSGDGITIPYVGNPGDSVLWVEGSPTKSAIMSVVSGSAINVKIPDATAATYPVFIKNAKISRSAAPATSEKEALIDVLGDSIAISGDTSRTEISAKVGAKSIAVRSNPTIGGTPGTGGTIAIFGGKIVGVQNAATGKRVYVRNNLITAEITKGYVAGSARIEADGDVIFTTDATAGSAYVNHATAKIFNINGVADNSAIFAAKSSIEIANVDSVWAKGKATALKTAESGASGAVKVTGGVIRSSTGYAINAMGPVIAGKPLNSGYKAVLVSSGATEAAYSAINVKEQNVEIYDAEVRTTGTNVPAIRVASNGALGVITIDSVYSAGVSAPTKKTVISSAAGNGIVLAGSNSANHRVVVNGGRVEALGAATTYAINVTDGNVVVNGGEVLGGGSASGIYLTGSTAPSVKVNNGKVTVKGGTDATAAIRVSGKIKVKIGSAVVATVTDFGLLTNKADIEAKGAKAIGIDSDKDTVVVDYNSHILVDGGYAIRSNGGAINIGFTDMTGTPMSGANGDTVIIEGNSGTLIRSNKPSNNLVGIAGNVTVGIDQGPDVSVITNSGIAISTDDTVYVYGNGRQDAASRIVPNDAPYASPKGVIVSSITGTAILVGTSTNAGTVKVLDGGQVHAYGAALPAKNKPIAIQGRFVYVQNGGQVFAGTAASHSADESEYDKRGGSEAIGIYVPYVKGLKGEVVIGAGNGHTNDFGSLVYAFGNGTGISCADTNVVTYVTQETGGITNSTSNTAVTVRTGNNGTAIKSFGHVIVTGTTSQGTNKGGTYTAHVWTANGDKAKAISIPVNSGALRRHVVLHGAFIEAGSDKAIGISTGNFVLDTLGDNSVVLVRNGSWGVKSDWGVYIQNSYIEVLATEDDTTGTAIEARSIRIDGVKSEVHAKGTALYDVQGEGAKIQVTGILYMSGTLATNMVLGSSPQGSSGVTSQPATLSMGSVSSARMGDALSMLSELVQDDEGKTLVIPSTVTISVTDNGSALVTEDADTLRIFGKVTTIGNQSGASFVNTGKVIVEKNGDVQFNVANTESFRQDGGLIVLKTGSKLNGNTLVIDTAKNDSRKYTFLKWADSLSFSTARGPGRVIVPPVFAKISADWGERNTKTDTVYTVVTTEFQLDTLFADYADTAAAKPVFVDSLLTLAGTFVINAKAVNEAGEATKAFTHNVLKVPLNKITERQLPGSLYPYFYGYVLNADSVAVPIRDNTVEIKYSGKSIQQNVFVRGDTLVDNDGLEYNGYFSGLGVAQMWYEGDIESGTYYQFSSAAPVNQGTYNVYASFNAGVNFVEVKSDKAVYLGQIIITEGTIESVFGKKTDYIIDIDLPKGKALNNVKVNLPSLDKYAAAYFGEESDLLPQGLAAEAYVDGSANIQKDSILVFSVNDLSTANTSMMFNVGIDPEPANNFEQGLFVYVRVNFLSEANMIEQTPSYININYVDEKLSGFIVGRSYTINGTTFKADTSEIKINSDWLGTTLDIVAIKTNEYKKDSPVFALAVGIHPAAPAALLALTTERASTATATDGAIVGTTRAMQYRLGTTGDWKTAGNTRTSGLAAGTYSVRMAATDTSFSSEAVLVTIAATVSVAENDREIPTVIGGEQAVVVPVAIVSAEVTVGPNPVAKSAGEVGIFWSGSKSVKGTLAVFDAVGNKVANVSVNGGKGKIGSWNVSNVTEGTYLLKGVLTDKDGNKVKVSTVVGVR